MFLCFLLFGALALRILNPPFVQSAKEGLAGMAAKNQSVAAVFSTIGETLAEQKEFTAVFGQVLTSVFGPAKQAYQTQQDDQPVINTQEYDVEIDRQLQSMLPDEYQTGQIDPTSETPAPTVSLGANPAITPMVYEAPMPDSINQSIEDFFVKDNEFQDDTAPVPFSIPSPDVVDDNTYAISFKFQKPLEGRLSSPFGYRDHPIDGHAKFHYGIDIAQPKGTPVKAFAAGTVYQIAKGEIYGNTVRIRHADGFTSFYAHLDKVTVKQGQTVDLSTRIGNVGTTGVSSGPHLHFEVRKDDKILNPQQYIYG